MKRGDLYRVAHPSHDPKKSRFFVVVSRQVVIDSRFSTVICAPVYTAHDGLASQVPVGQDEGLKHDTCLRAYSLRQGSIHCDKLVSLPKSVLTNLVGSLPHQKTDALKQALRIALDIAG